MTEISFNAEKHQYTNKAGEVYISCTQLVSLFVPEFDKEFWLYYKSLQRQLGFDNTEAGKKAYAKFLIVRHGFNFKDKNISKLQEVAIIEGVHEGSEKETKVIDEEWKTINKDALTRGTNFHNAIEEKQLGSVKYEFVGKKDKVLVDSNFHGDISKINQDGIIPELRLYNHKYKIAGTTDQPYFELPFVDINDWKSNRAIKFENKHEKLLYCLSHLDACNFVEYNIQLSLYGWMLEQYGYKLRNLGITHILFNNNGEASHKVYYPMQYLKREVEMMLEYYDKNLRK